jgi:hypothetical protein
MTEEAAPQEITEADWEPVREASELFTHVTRIDLRKLEPGDRI